MLVSDCLIFWPLHFSVFAFLLCWLLSAVFWLVCIAFCYLLVCCLQGWWLALSIRTLWNECNLCPTSPPYYAVLHTYKQQTRYLPMQSLMEWLAHSSGVWKYKFCRSSLFLFVCICVCMYMIGLLDSAAFFSMLRNHCWSNAEALSTNILTVVTHFLLS